MAQPFYPIFLIILIALLVAAGMLSIGFVVGDLLGLRRKTPVKLMPYESGMDPIGSAHQRYDVRYYLIAIVFLLFDVELLFLYPWAVAAYGVHPLGPRERQVLAPAARSAGSQPGPLAAVGDPMPDIPRTLHWAVFWEIVVFIGILAGAYVYAWRKGVFRWR